MEVVLGTTLSHLSSEIGLTSQIERVDRVKECVVKERETHKERI